MVKSDELYPKTCQLFYDMAFKRVTKIYNVWKELYPEGASPSSFAPKQRKLFKAILNGERTEDNPYYLTPTAVKVVLAQLKTLDKGRHNENEIYWGEDVESYLEVLFVTALLELQERTEADGETPYYTKYWQGIPLEKEEDIRVFYQNFVLKNNENFYMFRNGFLDFIENEYTYLDYSKGVNIRKDETVGEFPEKERERIVDEKEQIKALNEELKARGEKASDFKVRPKKPTNTSQNTLTFEALPKKIKKYIEDILFPFVGGICLHYRLSPYINGKY